MLTAVRPTMMPRIVDSHGSGMTGVLVDDMVVDLLAVSVVLGGVTVSGLVVAEVCTEMD